MAKIKKEQFYFRDPAGVEDAIVFDADISVSASGMFYCSVPDAIAEKLSVGGIEIQKDRKYGHFNALTMDALVELVKGTIRPYFERTLVKSKVVILYKFKSVFKCATDASGNIYPNGTFAADSKWVEGTSQSFFDREGFIMDMACTPFKKTVYQYKSGNQKTIYESLSQSSVDKKEQPNLHWLTCLVGMPNMIERKQKKEAFIEIEYTEEVAEFFVKFIKVICSVSMKLSDLSPDAVKLLSAPGTKLLE